MSIKVQSPEEIELQELESINKKKEARTKKLFKTLDKMLDKGNYILIIKEEGNIESLSNMKNMVDLIGCLEFSKMDLTQKFFNE